MIVYVIISVILVVYLLLKRKSSYWSRVGLESYKSKSFESIEMKVYNAYFHFKQRGAKHGGTFYLFNSIYIPVDLEIMKCILQADFNHFVNRGFVKDPPPMLKHLINMEDEEWRMLRAKLTPTFTSGKMKMIFHTMLEKALILEEVFQQQATTNEPTDLKDIFSRYTTDIISSSAFGFECNSLKNPNEDFRRNGEQLLDRLKIFFALPQVVRSLLKVVGVRQITEEKESYFLDLIKDTMHYRRTNNIIRKDFMHLLLQLKHRGEVGDDDGNVENNNNNVSGEHLSLVQVTAQCLIFFIAGYETSATTMTFAMLELAQNQEIQNKLRKDIRDAVKEYGGKITYEALMKMKYLDKVFQESLRKNPPAQLLLRKCNKDYPVPGTTFVIKKGQQIIFPVRAIHNDPENWPDPEIFDPERFSSENKGTRHRYAYIPFGEGPRMCIGARFGIIQSKIGIASIIKNFRLILSDKTPKPIEIDYGNVLPTVKGNLWMNIEKIE